ncbi:amidase [Mesorhizobium sp. ES1-1]|uniref:amidase n=1 Tax=Mesorhizobium sp. ES1-1 TaxID=2876629 RepID=UPI001CCC2225|nr:amidase [Mesorhizobium sp. ES1-1]MBZ9676216.1 amidase [Mesorhizobium sp. ES1-1]
MNHASTPSVDGDATGLSSAIAERRLSCERVMRDHLDRIERLNPEFNAIVSLRDPEALMQDAQAADAALSAGRYGGWLHGLPVAIKDLAETAGLTTTYGSPLYADNVPDADCLMAERIRSAGAIFIGKTNTPEFGLGSHTYNPVFGTTRNAYDPSLSAGGSSGGAAVALALRLLPVADGSDMMGSLRNPAGWNNIWGFRPSFGRVPDLPADELFLHQLSTSGPMARSVRDLARLLDTLAGETEAFPLSLPSEAESFAAGLDSDVGGLRVGWIGDWGGYYPTDANLLDTTRNGLEALAAQGAIIEPIEPYFDPALLWKSWMALRQWSVSAGHAQRYEDAESREKLKPELRWEIEGGLRLSAADIHAASVIRSNWVRWLNGAFSRFDVLALPTAQVFAFDATISWPRQIAGRAMDTYHRWMEIVIPGTLSGHPVLAAPAGFDDRGRSIGVQLIGRPRGDRRLLQIARAYERSAPWIARTPPAISQAAM